MLNTCTVKSDWALPFNVVAFTFTVITAGDSGGFLLFVCAGHQCRTTGIRFLLPNIFLIDTQINPLVKRWLILPFETVPHKLAYINIVYNDLQSL